MFAIVAMVFTTGCDKLPLQKAKKYNPEALDPHQHMACWDYIQTRPDLAILAQAITACDMTGYYRQIENKYTYLLLNEAAFTNASYGILKRLGISAVSDVEAFPEMKQKLKNVLLFHIIKGEYHGYNKTLGYDPVHVITLWQDVSSVMTMKLFDGFTDDPRVLSNGRQDRLVLMDQCGNSPVIEVTAMTNLLLDNGAAHVIQRECLYVSF